MKYIFETFCDLFSFILFMTSIAMVICLKTFSLIVEGKDE